MLLKTKLASTVTATVLLIALSGCSQDKPGNPLPQPSSTHNESTPTLPPTDSPTNNAEAPSVNTPLDASKFIADPCLVLTQKQIQALEGSKPGSRTDDGNGVGCLWQLTADSSAAAGVDFLPKITNGLSFVYKQNAAHFFDGGYFEPTEINGYPAVYSNDLDRRSRGVCSIKVGISDQVLFSVLIQWNEGEDACKAAENVAKATLNTIQGGQ